MYIEINTQLKHVEPSRKLDFEHPAERYWTSNTRLNGSYIKNKHVEKVGCVMGNHRKVHKYL